MRQLTSIVARNGDGAIGSRNRLPWRIKTDLQFFRRETLNNVVIMGRRTHGSLGGCLPRRINIVVTHGFALAEGPNCRSAGGIEEALCMANASAKKAGDAYVIGGATMYEQFAPFVDRYLITQVSKEVADADTFFDNEILGDLSHWNKRTIMQGQSDGFADEADFVICEYVLKDPSVIIERRNKILARHHERASRPLHSWDYAHRGACAT